MDHLNKVNVAAAGRALKTERAKVTVDIMGKPMITKTRYPSSRIKCCTTSTSLCCIKQKNGENHQYYYCVGYSVLYYRLDDQEIGSLIDQQGR